MLTADLINNYLFAQVLLNWKTVQILKRTSSYEEYFVDRQLRECWRLTSRSFSNPPDFSTGHVNGDNHTRWDGRRGRYLDILLVKTRRRAGPTPDGRKWDGHGNRLSALVVCRAQPGDGHRHRLVVRRQWSVTDAAARQTGSAGERPASMGTLTDRYRPGIADFPRKRYLLPLRSDHKQNKTCSKT